MKNIVVVAVVYVLDNVYYSVIYLGNALRILGRVLGRMSGNMFGYAIYSALCNVLDSMFDTVI